MCDFAAIQLGGTDAFSVLVRGLRSEFATDAVEVLAAQFLDAEEQDFHWDGRVAERGLGPWEAPAEDACIELDRVAILGCLCGRWYAGIAIVDGDGRLWALHHCAHFGRQVEAESAFQSLH